MLYADIVEAVEKLKKRYHEDDPFLLCREKGVLLLPQPFGLDKDSIKGFYLQKKRIKTITYNSDLPSVLQRIIVAHELGHSELHDTLPEKAEEFRQNMELFHDYVRGGIEAMYEQFTDGCQTQDDYLSKTYEVMTTFKKELEGISYADEIAHLIR